MDPCIHAYVTQGDSDQQECTVSVSVSVSISVPVFCLDMMQIYSDNLKLFAHLLSSICECTLLTKKSNHYSQLNYSIELLFFSTNLS